MTVSSLGYPWWHHVTNGFPQSPGCHHTEFWVTSHSMQLANEDLNLHQASRVSLLAVPSSSLDTATMVVGLVSTDQWSWTSNLHAHSHGLAARLLQGVHSVNKTIGSNFSIIYNFPIIVQFSKKSRFWHAFSRCWLCRLCYSFIDSKQGSGWG